MIIFKTLIFLFALTFTIMLIEDAIEHIILHLKKDKMALHNEYTWGFMETFDGLLMFLTIVFWTGFYLINQL